MRSRDRIAHRTLRMVRRDLITTTKRELNVQPTANGPRPIDVLSTTIAELERDIANEEAAALTLLEELELSDCVIVTRHALSHITQVLVSLMDVVKTSAPYPEPEALEGIDAAIQKLVALIEEHDHGG